MEEVNDLLKRLGELEDAPLIWFNKKVYDMAQEIKRLKEEDLKATKIQVQVLEEILSYKDKEIERLKEENEQLKKELQTLKMSEETWLDINLGVNKENKK